MCERRPERNVYAAPARRVPQPIPWTLCQMVGRDDNGDQRALLLTNSQLIERVSKGDQQAFRALYDENVDRIYRLAYRMAGEENLAQDFTQEAFLRAYQRLDQFRGDAGVLHVATLDCGLCGPQRPQEG